MYIFICLINKPSYLCLKFIIFCCFIKTETIYGRKCVIDEMVTLFIQAMCVYPVRVVNFYHNHIPLQNNISHTHQHQKSEEEQL